MSKLNLVIPMGGAGSRFFKDGASELPKPLIKLNGKPFFYWATVSVLGHVELASLTFVVLQDHVDRFDISNEILSYFPDANIFVLPAILPGAVYTSRAGIEQNMKVLKNEYPVLFNDCDHLFNSREFSKYINTTSAQHVEDGLVTFRSDQPQYSYIRFDSRNRVVGTIEKVVVSNNAICGAYLFKNAHHFLHFSEKYLANCSYNEAFMSGVYNELCDAGENVRVFDTDFHVSFGTPAELCLITSDFANYERYFKDVVSTANETVVLCGHSGCRIFLLMRNGKRIVRKVSSNEHYNERLEAQMQKQMCWYQKDNSIVPKVVYSSYQDDNLFFFDSEYVEGISLAETVKYCSASEAKRFGLMLLDNIRHPVAHDCDFTKKIFSMKLDSLHNSLFQNVSASCDAALSFLREYDFDDVQIGPCHGDFTLENMIVSEQGEVHYIDFLDSFFNSPDIDLAKILQDTFCGWSYRQDVVLSDTLLENLACMTDVLLSGYCGNNLKKKKTIFALLLLNLVRIYPYAKDEKTITYLDQQVVVVMAKLKECVCGEVG